MSSVVIPTLRYKDAPKAIQWLCEAFGFEADLVVESDPGLIDHAQLRFGTGMVMLGSAIDNEYGQHIGSAQDADKPTAGTYVIVDDVAGHADKARAAGAEIIMEPEEQDYGGSNYTCRDFEGNIWSFGSYNPWAH